MENVDPSVGRGHFLGVLDVTKIGGRVWGQKLTNI